MSDTRRTPEEIDQLIAKMREAGHRAAEIDKYEAALRAKYATATTKKVTGGLNGFLVWLIEGNIEKLPAHQRETARKAAYSSIFGPDETGAAP